MAETTTTIATRFAKAVHLVRVAAKIHGRTVLIALGASGAGLALVRLAVVQSPGSGEQGLCYTLAGVAIAAAGKALVDTLQRGETYRQGAYTERAKAVQRILQHVRLVREAGREARAEFELIINPKRDLDGREIDVETDWDGEFRRRLEETRSIAFTEDVWIGREGVNAVRRFVEEVSDWDLEAFATPDALGKAITVEFEKLRLDLLAGLGFYFE